MNWEKHCKELAQKIYDELSNENDAVGGYDLSTITVDGKRYNIELSVYWESSNHFDSMITGVDDDFRVDLIAVDF
jgi:hypothetical protein